MISRIDLRKIARARLKDSNVLYLNRRYDGAVYLCGYVIEIALKARITKALRWSTGFPSTPLEFKNLQSFRTHNLDMLLRLSGIEHKIKTAMLAEWSIVVTWDPEVRYKPIGTATKAEAKNMIDATSNLLKAI